MVNEMLALLENVFLSLDLERNGEHPVHAGWKGVFVNWLHTDSFRTYWMGETDAPENKNGLCKEYSPAFRRYVDQVMKPRTGE